MLDAFALPFVQRGLAEVLLLSVAGGLLGTWIVLRGLAFYAHAVGTAAFPGLVLADGLAFAAPVGAFATAVVFAGAVSVLAGRRRTGYDSLTALVLVGCLAAGVILASDVFGSGGQVDTLLFGSLLALEPADLWLAGAASAAALAGTLLLGRRWLATGFDDRAESAQGTLARSSELALLGLIALATTAALAAVGALLTTALFVVPAATVRLWVNRIGPWQAGSVALVALEGTLGLWLSVETNTPPGAAIAVLAGAVFAVAAIARRAPRRGLAVAAVAGAAGLAGCGAGPSAAGGALPVVATTTQLGDLARQVGGPDARVTQILQPNTDPHEYEPRPRDVRETVAARVVLESGDGLDAWMGGVVKQSGTRAAVLDLAASARLRVAGEREGPEASASDPHWWHDPRSAAEAVRRMRAAFARADPQHRAGYARRADALLARIARLDADIRRCMATVPAAERKLVTDHDAFTYFARRYGITVVGAVIPSQSTEGQASAGATAALTRTIERERVRAIFPEASVNPRVARAIARSTGASARYTLYGDTLGPAGSSGATYLGMVRHNADAMVRGFTGGMRGCEGP